MSGTTTLRSVLEDNSTPCNNPNSPLITLITRPDNPMIALLPPDITHMIFTHMTTSTLITPFDTPPR